MRTRTISLCIGLLALCLSLSAQTYTTLYSFSGTTDGAYPFAGLIQGTDGEFYGTTLAGGANGLGTIFKIGASGALTTLYSFCQQSGCPDGYYPYAGLIQATNGAFYGVTDVGGANGDGTVFKIVPGGVFSTLYSFCSQSDCADGSKPFAALVQATNGDLYGTTSAGGVNGGGTVFKLTPSGALTTLYSFCSVSNCADGNSPQGKLIQATNGNLYGTTFQGGANSGGTIFSITLGGSLKTIYNFCSQSGCADGCDPGDGLVQASNGDFYGTTLECSANGFYTGNVFKFTPSGILTPLYSFCSQTGCLDGEYPNPSLAQAGGNGNLYGTTSSGGANAEGTFFEMTPSGALTTLYSFCPSGCVGGDYPTDGPLLATSGTFYGTTYQGGTGGAGAIFSLSSSLRPFVETQPTSGKVGAIVNILGTNLGGATGVTFDGTSTPFDIVSSSLITVRVPSGAETGPVVVTTPAGKLNSNVSFRVTPQVLAFNPTSGPVGTPVVITGVSLTQALGVGFGDQIPAKFTVNSDNQITATVPAGAKTGPIGVETKGGTGISSAKFTITQ